MTRPRSRWGRSGRLRAWWGRRTLRTRITVVVGVVALVALLAIARLAAGLLFTAVVSAGDSGLRERATVAAERVRTGAPGPLGDGIRVVDVAGTPVDGGPGVPVPPDALARLAAGEAVTVGDAGPGPDGTGPRRWVAVAVPGPDGAPRLVLAPRDLLGAFALLVGSAPWFLLAAVVGAALVALAAWAGTRAALGPVDRMRSAAAGLDPGERLPVPPADDELRALALALNDVLARRDDAVTRLERFTGDAAHELRSPLAALRAQADVAVAHPDAEPAADTWRSVADEAARLSDLLADLLALARADAGERAPARPVDLVAAARAVVDRDERDPGHRTPPGPPVATTLWAPLPAAVAAGDTEVAVVVANLVANARRHACSLVTVSVVPSGRGCGCWWTTTVPASRKETGPGARPVHPPRPHRGPGLRGWGWRWSRAGRGPRRVGGRRHGAGRRRAGRRALARPAAGLTRIGADDDGAMRAYVASPYGFAESTRLWYATVLLPLVARHVEVLDPWSVTPEDHPDPAERWLALGAHHLATVSGADLVVACLDQEPADAGTLVELAWAASRGIPVIAYRNDLRNSGEEGLRYNLMVGAAVRASGGTEVADLDALDAALARYADPPPDVTERRVR